MQPATLPLEVTAEELEALLESVREGLGEAGYQKLKAAIRTLGYLTELLRERKITLEGLRELLLSGAEASTEKTRHVLKQAGIETQKKNQEKQNSQANGKPARPGHGRHGVDAYGGAKKVQVPHPSLHSGDRCPGCGQGKVYVLEAPGVLVRLVGQAPITGTVYELEKLRCNLCLEVFTAEAPAGVGEEKYDATSASMMALLKYGSGLPFYRLEGLQEKLEIPLPASTQWGIMKATTKLLEPALEELIRQAAQGADHGGYGDGKERHFWGVGGRCGCHEEPSRGQAHAPQLQSRSGAAPQGRFQADPRHSKEAALFKNGVRTQTAH